MLAEELFSGPKLPIHCQLADLWTGILGKTVQSIDDSFFNLGGTPDQAEQMIAQAARLTETEITVTDFFVDPTIRSLADTIVAANRASDLFIRVQEGSGNIPFYFFHGDILGGGFYARRLAGMLGPEQPFIVSPPLPLAGDELPTVEEIASRKRHVLEAKQPNGPYILGGFCIGAVVAYELARQLELNGKEVSTVIMIEPELGDPVSRSQLHLIDRFAGRNLLPREKVEKFLRGRHKLERIRHVMKSSLEEKKEFVLRNSRKLFTKSAVDGAQPAPCLVPNPDQDGDAASGSFELDAYEWVLTSYAPHPYSGRVKILVTEETMEQTPHVPAQLQKAAPAAEVEQIPGTHLGSITTHLGAIAETIRRELRAIQSLVATMVSLVTENICMLPI